ncbi:MAG: hypothetical protein U0325_18145 [Polyangiales bacterium]
MRSPLCAALAALTLAPIAAADPVETDHIRLAVEPERGPRPSLALVSSFGALSHATTGTVANYGYDTATAPSLGLSARLLFPMPGCRCLAHGVELGYQGASGPSFGLAHGAAYTQHLADASYAVRVELPCLRRGDRRWWVTGALGVSVRIADAGTGDRARDDGAAMNERGVYANRYDHAAMGWRLGGAMDVTFGRMLVGVALDLRDLYGIDTELRRTTMMGASLRFGADFLL